MSTTVAALQAVFGADTNQFDQAVGHVKGSLAGVGQTVGGTVANVGQSMTRIGGQIGLATAPLMAFGGLSIRTASQFDSAMAEISARTGLVGADLEAVRDYALQMGADTAFSSQQAADAFLQLLTSGQTAEQAFATLPAVLDAAAASGADLGMTADLVTDIMASYGLEVDQAGAVTDALAQAAASSSADFSALGQGFANAGAVASNFGLSVDETAAALAVLSENGIKGAEAGTALKSMLLNMARDTEDVQGAWSELGISMYDAAGNARPLGTVLGELDSALDGMSTEQQNQYMQTLAGSYGIVALSAMRGEISIEEMQEAMSGQATAAEVAEKRMNTFAGAMDALQGSLETLQIKAFTPFMNDTLKPLVIQITGVINVLADWSAEHPRIISAVGTLVGGLAALSSVMLAGGTALGFLGAGLAALISPIGLVAVAAAGLAYAFQANFLGIRDAVQPVIDWIGPKLRGMWDTITSIDLSGLKSALDSALSRITLDTDSLTANIADQFNSLSIAGVQLDMNNIGQTVATHLLDVVLVALPMIIGGPAGLALGAAKLLATAFDTDFMGFRTWLEGTGVIASVESGLGVISDAIGGFFGGEGEGVDTSGLTAIVDSITGALQPLVDWLGDRAADLAPGLDAIRQGISGFIDAFSDTETEGITGALDSVVGAVGDVLGRLLETIAPFLEATTEFAGGALEAIGSFLPTIGESISGFITTISRALEGDFSGAAESFVGTLTGLVSGIGELAVNAGQVALDTFVNLFDRIAEIFGIDVDAGAVVTAIEDLIGAVGEFSFPESWNEFKGLALSIKNQVGSIFNRVVEAIDVIGGFVFPDQWNTFKDLALNVKDALTPIAGFIADVIARLAEIVVPVALETVSGLFDTIDSALDGLAGLVDAFIDAIGRIDVPQPLKDIADFVQGIVDGIGTIESFGGGGGGGGGSDGGGGGAGFRAGGGSVIAGATYRVNEVWGEYFTPSVPGRVMPLTPSSYAPGGGSGQVIVMRDNTIIIQGVNDPDDLLDQLQERARRRAGLSMSFAAAGI